MTYERPHTDHCYATLGFKYSNIFLAFLAYQNKHILLSFDDKLLS